METRSQRMLLVLIIFVLTLAIYRDFGGKTTVQRLTDSASFAGRETQYPAATALEPANATLGVRTQDSPYLYKVPC